MTLLAVLLALEFIRVTAPDGTTIELNARQIISLRQPREDERRGINNNVKCVIFTADSKYVSTLEPCDDIHDLIRSLGRE
jgi:hypothetical protein